MRMSAGVFLFLTGIVFITSFFTGILTPTGVSAQIDTLQSQQEVEKGEELQLPIGLTEEEKTRLHEIGMYQLATPPPATPVRKAAEWERSTGVLVRYSYGFGLPYAVLREFAEDITLHVLCVASQQTTCWNNLQNNGVNMANVDLINISTNSIWTRDYGPQIQFSNGVWGITDWVYNRPRPLDDDVPWQLGTVWGCSVYGTDLVATGGNFMSDGNGIGFSTDMIWNENPGWTHEQVAQEIEAYLGITNYVVVPDINPSGIHHIDVWAKLLDEETILVQEVAPTHAYYDSLEARVADFQKLTNCYGRPYKIVRILCGGIGGGDVAGYTNSLIMNNKVFVPLYGISTDAAALATYQAAMPGYEVLGFTGSWLEDDAIHCRGMEIHDRYMLVVRTNPLQDQETNPGDYTVTALIDDRSMTGLVADSLIVYWRLEGSPSFNAVTMQATAYPDSYYADIPQQLDSVNVEYYVFAKDNSGRREACPLVAPNGWYTFNTGGAQAVCSVQPSDLDFGTTFISSYKDTTFTITNTGADTLTGSVSESCEHYSIISGGGPFSLAADESLTVTVRFEPTVAGTHNCTIETGETACADVSCTGFGENPPVCSVVPDTLDFGMIAMGAYKDTTFTIANIGGDTLIGNVSEACGEYSIISGGGPYSLTAGQYVTVTVRFEATLEGTQTCTVETGQAICSDVFCTGYGQPAPVCSVVPDTLDFGTVLIGAYKDTTFTITNTGADTLIGDVSEACGEYSIVSGGGPYNLAADESLTVTVRFEPTAAGTQTCTVETGQEICTDVFCTGWGENPPVCSVVPDTLDFGTVDIGTYADIAFTITNTGGSVLTGDVTEACGEYSIVSGGGPYSLTAGQFVTVTVRFEPTLEGTQTCTVETGQAICSDVFCTGVGEEPPVCLVQPDSLDFGLVAVGSYRDETFSITNAGGDTLSGDVSEACGDYSVISGDGPYSLAADESLTVTVRFEPTATGTLSTYDFQTGGGTDKWFYASADCGSQPPGPPPDATEVTTYTEISQSDDIRYGTVYARKNYPIHDFRFTIAENEELITEILVEWEGYATDIAGTLWLYIWDSDASSWVQVDSTLQETGDDLLTGTFTSNLARFIDGSGYLWLAANCPAATSVGGGGTFYTDNVKVVVSCGPGETRTCTVETGQAICSDVFCTGSAGEEAPVCSVAPDTLDFGLVVIGDYADDTFTIKNTGGSVLTGDVSESCDHYDIISGGGPFSLAADESLTVTVRFEPTAPARRSAPWRRVRPSAVMSSAPATVSRHPSAPWRPTPSTSGSL